MLKSFVLMGGQFGYVDRYYDAHSHAWKDVPPWDTLDQPIIVIANGPAVGKLLPYNADCKTHGFYDWVNFLTDYAAESPEEQVTFDDLEQVAHAIGWASTFGRQVLQFSSTNVGRNLRPTLVTGATLCPIAEYATSRNADAFVSRLEKAGAQYAYAMGPHAVTFEFEVAANHA
jgi:hypothetical protein